MIDPFRLVPLGRPPTAFVHQQDRGIHHAVGERLQAQGGKTRVGVVGKDAAAAGAMIEIFQDHPGIEQHRAVLEQKRRDFAERILLAHAVARVHRVGGLDRDVAVEPEHVRRNPDLAHERGAGRTA